MHIKQKLILDYQSYTSKLSKTKLKYTNIPTLSYKLVSEFNHSFKEYKLNDKIEIIRQSHCNYFSYWVSHSDRMLVIKQIKDSIDNTEFDLYPVNYLLKHYLDSDKLVSKLCKRALKRRYSEKRIKGKNILKTLNTFTESYLILERKKGNISDSDWIEVLLKKF